MKKANMDSFYVESIEKENKMRVRWFLRNQDKLENMAEPPKTCKDTRTTDIFKFPPKMELEAIAVNRRSKPLRDGIIQVHGKDFKPGSADIAVMKAVDPEVRKLLCQDAPQAGRRVYLSHREHLKPDARYNDWMTQNTAYGWKLQDHKRVKGVHGRYATFQHDLVSRTLPHIPDPDHYKEPTKYKMFCA